LIIVGSAAFVEEGELEASVDGDTEADNIGESADGADSVAEADVNVS
jgi:hypothetical protein